MAEPAEQPLCDSWQKRLHATSAHALYLHIPFCARKCAYCDFSSWETRRDDPLMAAYVRSLERQLEELAGVGLLDACKTAYVGGGTPTLLGGELAALVRQVSRRCPQLVELTCEANPDSLTDELLQELPSAGCTRLSVGVQSLGGEELHLLGRLHTADQARERLAAAVSTGLAVSCDLMCATPAQTDASWAHTLEGVIAAGVGHVSVYPLQIEEGTAFGTRYAGDVSWNDPEIQARRMEAARVALEAAGFSRYEVASYALTGRECLHNEAYWTGRPYVGLGTGASSMLTREGYDRLRGIAPQLPRVHEDVARVRLTCTTGRQEIAHIEGVSELHFDLELLSEAQAAAEDLMLAMRMVRGAGHGLLAHARKVLGTEPVDEAIAWCEERGLARMLDASLTPTDQGWLLGNELYGTIWDLAPGDVRTASA